MRDERSEPQKTCTLAAQRIQIADDLSHEIVNMPEPFQELSPVGFACNSELTIAFCRDFCWRCHAEFGSKGGWLHDIVCRSNC